MRSSDWSSDVCSSDLYEPTTPLSGSKDYMHLKFAATEGIPKDVHFVLIESVAEHIIDTLYVQDDRIEAVEVKIVKLAIAEEGEQIGITMRRDRKSVVEGKRVSDRVDLGGRRIIKKKKNITPHKPKQSYNHPTS